jgi:hypothetical protein
MMVIGSEIWSLRGGSDLGVATFDDGLPPVVLSDGFAVEGYYAIVGQDVGRVWAIWSSIDGSAWTRVPIDLHAERVLLVEAGGPWLYIYDKDVKRVGVEATDEGLQLARPEPVANAPGKSLVWDGHRWLGLRYTLELPVLLESSDGRNWTEAGAPLTRKGSYGLRIVKTHLGMFYEVRDETGITLVTLDGVSSITLDAQSWLVPSAERIFAQGRDGSISYSTDLETWTDLPLNGAEDSAVSGAIPLPSPVGILIAVSEGTQVTLYRWSD